jgi:hypothetical protein
MKAPEEASRRDSFGLPGFGFRMWIRSLFCIRIHPGSGSETLPFSEPVSVHLALKYAK